MNGNESQVMELAIPEHQALDLGPIATFNLSKLNTYKEKKEQFFGNSGHKIDLLHHQIM